jgi:hypothetical protein
MKATEVDMQPMSEEARLSLGQRLMLGLVIAPGALLMALGPLFGTLSSRVLQLGTVETVVNWLYVLFMACVAAGTLTMAVTGKVPGDPR